MILRKRAEEILDLVKKAENEIVLSDKILVGDVYIGAGETDGIRLLARTAGILRREHPGIHYHISSGNSKYVTENLDKGLLDFGLIFGNPDLKKYNSLPLPFKDVWGVLMPAGDLLEEKESISPEDLWDKPLLISQEETEGGPLLQWMKKKRDSLNITVAYNLLFNASLFVEEGLGYAICFDKIIPTAGNRPLVFRPLNPPLEAEMNLIWKKYQIFSKPAEKFLNTLKETVSENTHDFSKY